MSRRQQDDRDRDRDRDRGSRSQAASARTNEYFVPKEGIDREVITADICRYLGNDALVRPGIYEDPQTRISRPGYFITAYRNLTTAMIDDLKADSKRWEAEREQSASRQTSNVQEYRASTTHQSRQYYGPSEAVPGGPPSYTTTSTISPTSAAGDPSYDPRSQYTQPYSQTSPYSGVQPAHFQDSNNYYVAGANYQAESSASGRGLPPQPGGIPRSAAAAYSSSAPVYQTTPDDRQYYSNQPPSSMSNLQYATQQSDPYYGRATPTTGPSDYRGEIYDSRGYPEPMAYSQAQIPSSTSTSSSSRRPRDEDRERHRRRH